jgi:hypothetical protein
MSISGRSRHIQSCVARLRNSAKRAPFPLPDRYSKGLPANTDDGLDVKQDRKADRQNDHCDDPKYKLTVRWLLRPFSQIRRGLKHRSSGIQQSTIENALPLRSVPMRYFMRPYQCRLWPRETIKCSEAHPTARPEPRALSLRGPGLHRVSRSDAFLHRGRRCERSHFAYSRS